MLEFHHTSVLLQECLDGLNIQPDGIYVDGTMGGGGHSKEIIKRLSAGMLIAIDQDQNAIAKGSDVLKAYPNKILVQDSFFHIQNILARLEIDAIQGALLDLGVSSYQLDTAERGFSYQKDAPLDMRMNQEQSITAYHIVNRYGQKELENIIYRFGEERWAKRIAAFIVEEREKDEIQTTAQLVAVIKKAIPKAKRKDGPHPAKRTFQAIRIAVNEELDHLENTIRDFVQALSKGGRLCIITFHSLEDRIVKTTFKSLADPCTCPIDFPVCMCGLKPTVKIITRKPILPSERELEENPRARSAKLRIVERI